MSRCLLLLHILFTVRRKPTRAAIQQIKKSLVESVLHHARDPHARWVDCLTSLNTCHHPAFRKPSMVDIRRLDPAASCAHFDACFSAASQFDLVIVGTADAGRLQRLVEKWLASIPPAATPEANRRREPAELTPLGVRFPRGVTHKRLSLPMIDAGSSTQLTWRFTFDASRHEYLQTHELSLASKVLELRLMQRLRFETSAVYQTSVRLDLGTYLAPDPSTPFEGTLIVSFSSDATRAASSVELARAELQLLLCEGATEADLTSARQISAREHEDATQTNQYWLSRLAHAVSSGRVEGAAEDRFRVWEELRLRALADLSAQTVKRALGRLDMQNFTVVTLVPSTLPPICTNATAIVHESLLRCVAPPIEPHA